MPRRPFLYLYGLWVAGLAAAGLMAGCGPHSFRVTETVRLTAGADQLSRLQVKNQVGDVRIVGDPSAKEVVAEVTKIGKGINPAEAARALDEIELSLSPKSSSGGDLQAVATHPRQSGVHSWEVDWHITAPPGLALAVATGVGDVRVEGFDQGASVSTGVGEVVLQNIRGKVVASSGVGDLVADGLAGPVELDTGVGDIRLGELSGSSDLRASTGVGSVRATLPLCAKGRLTVGSGVGSVHLNLDSIPLSHLRHTRQRLSVLLNGAAEPELHFSTQVGEVTVNAR